MKLKLSRILPAAIALAVLPYMLPAQPAPSFVGHYPVGIEGIKGASVPGPGLYAKDYNVMYWSDRLPDGPPNFDLFAYINAPRLIWMTGLKILGADYGVDIIVPFGYQSVEAGPFDDSEFDIGDIAVEPLVLSWHPEPFDVAVGYAFWAPTGDYDVMNPAKLGKGFWTNMFTAGATWYPDEEKTWAVSILNRYEINTENDDVEITPGQTFTMEWGISKNLWKTVDFGVVGYYQQQTTKDGGRGASDIQDYTVGVGGEINVFWPSLTLFTSLRYVREVAVKDRPLGNNLVLTFTKIF